MSSQQYDKIVSSFHALLLLATSKLYQGYPLLIQSYKSQVRHFYLTSEFLLFEISFQAASKYLKFPSLSLFIFVLSSWCHPVFLIRNILEGIKTQYFWIVRKVLQIFCRSFLLLMLLFPALQLNYLFGYLFYHGTDQLDLLGPLLIVHQASLLHGYDDHRANIWNILSKGNFYKRLLYLLFYEFYISINLILYMKLFTVMSVVNYGELDLL